MLGGLVVRVGDRLLMSINRRLADVGVPPHWMNALELASAVACAVCFAHRLIPLAVVLLVIHGVFDYLDGGLRRAARRVGRRFPSAPCVHTVADKLSDVLLFLSLAMAGWVAWGLSVTASGATVAVSVLGWWGQRRRGLPREACLFDRSDRIFVLAVLSSLSLFTPAVLITVVMNGVVLAQRVRSLARGACCRPTMPGAADVAS